MPELPEVETIVRELKESKLIGKVVCEVNVFWSGTIADLQSAVFCKRILNQTILNIKRRGKFIIFELSCDTLLVHLRMTGKFTIQNEKIEPSFHERIRLGLDDGRTLLYEDQRKFGKWYLLSDPEIKLSTLGIEPLSKQFTLKSQG